jgi:hypothetical protein
MVNPNIYHPIHNGRYILRILSGEERIMSVELVESIMYLTWIALLYHMFIHYFENFVDDTKDIQKVEVVNEYIYRK